VERILARCRQWACLDARYKRHKNCGEELLA
jgi:hypothetical protein